MVERSQIFSENESKTQVLSTGYEALFRGLIESQVGFGAMYPGTPVSEVGDLLYDWSKKKTSNKFIFDYSINEKVAIESSIGAAWSGIRAVVLFKHVGLNVALDSLHSIMYSGIDPKNGAGMVIVVGGDPQISSSTNAEDVRLISLHTHIPIIYPASVEELRKFAKYAFELSEIIGLPIMIYTTPKLIFATGLINLEKVEPNTRKAVFCKDPNRYINAIHYAINNQKRLLSKIEEIKQINEKTNDNNPLEKIISKINNTPIQISNDNATRSPLTIREIVIITAGLPYLYISEILNRFHVAGKIPILKLNLIYPIIEQQILSFIETYKPKKIVIIEELEPLIEDKIKIILYEKNYHGLIYGKSIFPRIGELTPDIIETNFLKNFGKDLGILEEKKYKKLDDEIAEFRSTFPIREPTFCPGCSHRNVFYALRKVADDLKKKTNQEIIFGGDIGCYTMGMSAPYSAIDWLICMGAGIGIANGIERVFHSTQNKYQYVVALIGDSTFFHAGIQPLLNILKENLNITIIILNNYYTAMTGHQPTLTSIVPEINKDPNIGFQNKQLDFVQFIKNLGVQSLTVLDGYNIPLMRNTLEKLFIKGLKNRIEHVNETQIVIVNAECALMVKSRADKKWNIPRGSKRGTELYLTISESCPRCHECFARFGCTAIKCIEHLEKGIEYIIDESACLKEYCKSCIDVCPNHCIEKIIIEPSLDKSKTSVENEKKNTMEVK